jgi:hypothetical protein
MVVGPDTGEYLPVVSTEDRELMLVPLLYYQTRADSAKDTLLLNDSCIELHIYRLHEKYSDTRWKVDQHHRMKPKNFLGHRHRNECPFVHCDVRTEAKGLYRCTISQDLRL